MTSSTVTPIPAYTSSASIRSLRSMRAINFCETPSACAASSTRRRVPFRRCRCAMSASRAPRPVASSASVAPSERSSAPSLQQLCSHVFLPCRRCRAGSYPSVRLPEVRHVPVQSSKLPPAVLPPRGRRRPEQRGEGGGEASQFLNVGAECSPQGRRCGRREGARRLECLTLVARLCQQSLGVLKKGFHRASQLAKRKSL